MNAQKPYKLSFSPNEIFNISNEEEFEKYALETFRFQWSNNAVYRRYCDLLKIDVQSINRIEKIPFLPISFFKTHPLKCFKGEPAQIFTSSGTTGMSQSKHYIKSLALYEKSFQRAFENKYGPIEDFLILGLLPSYLEREGSSLIYMVDKFIQSSKYNASGFFLDNYEEMLSIIDRHKDDKILLIGVSYALLDLGEKFFPDLSNCLVMETGGMKGKRKEMVKSTLHATLKRSLNLNEIHSEYGMTELLSQAYSTGEKFQCPNWMRVLTRAYNDPFEYVIGKTGGINIIDLANIYSCSFIATDDLGKVMPNHFEVVGRYDNSDIRGCNLLVQ